MISPYKVLVSGVVQTFLFKRRSKRVKRGKLRPKLKPAAPFDQKLTPNQARDELIEKKKKSEEKRFDAKLLRKKKRKKG